MELSIVHVTTKEYGFYKKQCFILRLSIKPQISYEVTQ